MTTLRVMQIFLQGVRVKQESMRAQAHYKKGQRGIGDHGVFGLRSSIELNLTC